MSGRTTRTLLVVGAAAGTAAAVHRLARRSGATAVEARCVFPPLRSSAFSWAFVLRPFGESATRLLVRARVDYSPT